MKFKANSFNLGRLTPRILESLGFGCPRSIYRPLRSRTLYTLKLCLNYFRLQLALSQLRDSLLV